MWEEIGRHFGITCERARQIGKKGLEAIEREKYFLGLEKDPDAPLKFALLRVKDVFSGFAAGQLLRAGHGDEGGVFERVGDLAFKTDAEILKFCGIGKKTLREVRELLGRFGLNRMGGVS